MKTLGSKIAYVKRYLNEGKKITDKFARERCMNYTRLASGINRLKSQMWIINVGKPGSYAEYIKLERGQIKGILFRGFKLHIINAHYIDGLADMEVFIIGHNGDRSVNFTVNSDAFRSKKVMENKLKEALS